MESYFKVKTKDLKSGLTAITRLGLRFDRSSMLKINVLTDTIQISTTGITRVMKAETEGLADLILPALVLKGYSSTNNSKEISFRVTEGELRCGSFIFRSPFIKIETVFNLPEDPLPINHSLIQRLRQNVKRSPGEIERLNLRPVMEADEEKIKHQIEKALKYLGAYDINFDDLHDLIQKKIDQ